ncbi:MAG: hypothetical protein HPY44_08165 [Armatimonadetes bacterium]|nr:hypothetical protein [Armatimonadota bacterium]
MKSLVVAVTLALSAPIFAQIDGMVVIPLKWMDATTLAAMLGGEAPTQEQLTSSRQEWVNHFARTLVRGLPEEIDSIEPRWQYGATAFVSASEQVRQGQQQGVSALLPAGLYGPPVALADQNAILARGTPAAIDQLREIIHLLDVKPRMVNIEARLVDAPASRTDEWGIDFGRRFADMVISTSGNLPGGGLQVVQRDRDGWTAAGVDRRETTGQAVTGASITATNNIPAIITMGRMLPYFTSEVTYDEAGRRFVQTRVDAIFIGTELFVQPRINNNDTVTMLIRPTFIEGAGSIIGPNGVAVPITQTVGTETLVTVPDGATLQIAGFERGLDEYNTRFSGALKMINARVESHPALFVTPRIIHDLEEPGDR